MRTVAERLASLADLREAMRAEGIDAYIITMFDDHNSEYVADYWRRIDWLSGFSGSAGTLAITLDEAALWADGRYVIQAEEQLAGTGIVRIQDRLSSTPKLSDWLLERVGKEASVATDGRTLSMGLAATLRQSYPNLRTDADLITPLWQERPNLAQEPLRELPLEITGESRQDRLQRFREELSRQAEGCEHTFIASLDDIAYLLNLRGADVPNNPVFYAFLAVEPEGACLFVDLEKVTPELEAALAKDGVRLQPYEAATSYLQGLQAEHCPSLCLDPNYTNIQLADALHPSIQQIQRRSPSVQMRAIKNETELANLRQTQLAEGVALTKLAYWIKHWPKGESPTEWEVSEKIAQLRREQGAFDESFGTIAAFDANAAQMHYGPSPEKCSRLSGDGILLVDTGGHYPGGTTDTTRTFSIGAVNPDFARDYTLTLKSHIDLASAVFMKGTTGQNLDILARLPMWRCGLDYKCGTGHGVGYLLSVHEGPQNISMGGSHVPLEIGMIVTDEPGVYREDQWGIRIENDLLVQKKEETDCGLFYHFEVMTFCPIDVDPIQVELLSPEEKAWLNAYHAAVYERLASRLEPEEAAWLAEVTAAI